MSRQPPTKDELIKLFETEVVPMIPLDWKYGDDLRLFLEYEDSEWMFSTGPIGENSSEFSHLEGIFYYPMLSLAKAYIPIVHEHINQYKNVLHSCNLTLTFNRTTKKLTCRGSALRVVEDFEGEINL